MRIMKGCLRLIVKVVLWGVGICFALLVGLIALGLFVSSREVSTPEQIELAVTTTSATPNVTLVPRLPVVNSFAAQLVLTGTRTLSNPLSAPSEVVVNATAITAAQQFTLVPSVTVTTVATTVAAAIPQGATARWVALPTATSTLPITPAPTATGQVKPMATATRLPSATPTNTPLPTATPTNSPMPVATATAVPTQPAGPVINRNANLRAGPGTAYAVVGGVTAGEAVTVVGQDAAGEWVKLASGAWIASFLVKGLPTSLMIIEPPAPVSTPTATASAVQPTAVPVTVTALAVPPTSVPPTPVPPTPVTESDGNGETGSGEAFVCNGGCAEPPPGSTCVIKGNVNPSSDTRIYHSPGGRYYDKTDIKPEEGDRWFCTTGEAEAAGFRASQQ